VSRQAFIYTLSYGKKGCFRANYYRFKDMRKRGKRPVLGKASGTYLKNNIGLYFSSR